MIAVKHTAPRTAEVVEFEDPVAEPGSVVVDMRAGGICGSDLHVYRREPWDFTPVLGHEPCGVVSEVGEGVRHLRVGDRVSVYHYEACNLCRNCRRGELHWCPQFRAPGWHFPGSCGSRVAIKAVNALPLDDGLSFEDGALVACGAGTTWSALSKVRPNAEDKAVVFGLGPVGLCGVAMLAAMGVEVLAVGRRAARLELARTFGASEVIDIDLLGDQSRGETAETSAVVDSIRKRWPDGATLAYETSGQPSAQRQMIDALGRFGRAVVVGIGNREPAINLASITGRQIALYGSHVLNFADYEPLVAFLIEKDLKLDRMVTHRVPYAQGDEAFRIADTGDCGKVVLVND